MIFLEIKDAVKADFDVSAEDLGEKLTSKEYSIPALNAFRQNPLLRLNDEQILITDLRFVADMMTSQIHWYLTLRKYFDDHFQPEYLETGVRKATREGYEGAFTRHILPVLGDIPINEITRAQVKAFVIEKTKTDRIRRVDMHDELIAALQLHEKSV